MYSNLNIQSKIGLTQDRIAHCDDDPYEIYLDGFWRYSDELLSDAENQLGFKFPAQLRHFYIEVGVGTFRPKEKPQGFSFNNVLIPAHIPKLIAGTCGWMMPYTQIEPNTLPFFERDVDLFLCLKPQSDNPNAVWWMWGELMPNGGKICDSLVEFFERLVEDPNWFSPPKP